MGEIGKSIEWWDHPGQKRDYLLAKGTPQPELGLHVPEEQQTGYFGTVAGMPNLQEFTLFDDIGDEIRGEYLTPEAEEVWRQAREIAAGLPDLMPPGPIEGGFLGNPPLDERYPDADRILGQGVLDPRSIDFV